ncbi:homoserine kinase [Bailinhaonella thermotolerans]|uniref:Homoserine kinase n=1 Tax=Bailinhaonella thermotolerans TaxID=1070861 RepID=A0A3A4A8T1_9ACTN|nr:homoserine kinase [Bailinhaonella thermotolerans]RJL24491.1 homoserine kinase [Bailinhaonella thermotolerans]
MSTPAFTARVPATSANLGPGFDALGLALTLYDEVTAATTGNGVTVEVIGEGAGEVPADERHLVVRTMRAAWDRMGAAQPENLTLRCHNRIPHGRGLGSSSAAICAGILLARALAGAEPEDTRHRADAKLSAPSAKPFSDQDVYALADELEGHPDNVAPCLAGGFTIAWRGPGAGPGLARLEPSPEIRPVALVPGTRLLTETARGLLPAAVPHADAAANAGRAALLVAALTQRPDLLLPATEDRLHQDYREPGMPDTLDLVRRLRARGVPAVVSGAGPTVLAFSSGETLDSIASEVGNAWHIQPLNVDRDGAHVLFA